MKNTFLKLFKLIIYYSIAFYLPNYSFPGGKIFNLIRIWCLKDIISLGSNCRIMRKVYIGDGNNISIGNNCRINECVRLNNVSIGDNVLIARESIILGEKHIWDKIDTPIISQGNTQHFSIIEDDVWIGLRVVIMPGIKIGNGAIVGACSVVTKDIDSYSISTGIPSKKIKSRI